MKKKKSEKRLAREIIESLREPAPLSNNKGRFEHTSFRWYSKKDRKNDGRVTPTIIHPGMKWSEIIENALEPQIFWDDWVEFRDGFRRDTFESDEDKKIKKDKIKKETKIRRARKQKNANSHSAR